MVDAEPDVTRLERLLKPGVGRRLRVRVFPELLHVVPHRGRVRALVGRDEAAGVRGVEVTLDEPMDEPIGREREPELLLSGLVEDVLRPRDRLLIGERVHVGTRRQVLQSLLRGDHEIRRLHPRDVDLCVAAEFPEREHVLRNLLVLVLVGDLGDVVERPGRHERRELAVLETGEADLPGCAGLGLGRDPVEDDRLLVGDEIHRCSLVGGQDLLAHVLLFGHGAELGRGEDERIALIARRRPAPGRRAGRGTRRDEDRRGRRERKCARAHPSHVRTSPLGSLPGDSRRN